MRVNFRAIFNYLFAVKENLGLEIRLFISTILISMVITVVSNILGTILDMPIYLRTSGYFIFVFLGIAYYFVRFRKVYKPFILMFVIVCMGAVTTLFVYGGGMDSQNMLIMTILFILSLIIVSRQARIAILTAYILLNSGLFMIERLKHEWIVPYNSHNEQWLDGITTTIYSVIFLYIIIQFLLRNYTFERVKAEAGERKLSELNKTLESRIEERTREIQKARQDAEVANRAKSDFLLNISHEFRTPLNAITGYAGLLENADAASTREYVASIRESSRRLTDMVDDILELMRAEKSEFIAEYDYVDTRHYFNGFEERFSGAVARKNLVFKTILSFDLPDSVYIDVKRVRLVISDLLENAVKHTEQGMVELHVYPLVRENEANRNLIDLIIEVIDTGNGIPGEHLTRIESMFSHAGEPAAPENLGIGLSFAARIIGLLKGRIQVFSQTGMGTKFVITLPDTVTRSELTSNEAVDAEAVIPFITGCGDGKVEDLKGLLSRLQGDLLDTCKTFESKQPISQVREFGMTLSGLGLKHNCLALADYGQNLANAADNFDIDGILTMIGLYPELIKGLKGL